MFPACDRVLHELVKFKTEMWSRLRLLGFQDDGEGGVLELRNCDVCRSTLAKPCPRLSESPKDTELQPETQEERR